MAPAGPVEYKPPMGIEDLSALDVRFRTLLESMYAREPRRGTDGLSHGIDRYTRVSAAEGMALYRSCVAAGFTTTLESGFARPAPTLRRRAGGTNR